MSRAMLSIPPQIIIAQGKNRTCILDPMSSRHCLKIECENANKINLLSRVKFFLAQGKAEFGMNVQELFAWREVCKRVGSEAHSRFAECHEIVNTAFGPSLRCTLILDKNGQPAPNLFDILSSRQSGVERDGMRYDPRALCSAVDNFATWLVEKNIPLFDMNAGNFVVVEQDGIPSLVCVDMKSISISKEIIPVSRWFSFLLRAKLRRRAARLCSRINKAFLVAT